MPESPADTLRRAADLVRKRAEAATSGPWRVEPDGTGTVWVQHPTAYVVCAGDETEPSVVADAEHIAAWHPAVGLAVAALFEAVANLAELTRAYDDGDGNQVETGPTAIEVAAYGAALAYLGAPGPD